VYIVASMGVADAVNEVDVDAAEAVVVVDNGADAVNDVAYSR